MSPIHLGYLKCLDRHCAAEQTVRVGFVSDKKEEKRKEKIMHFPLVMESN